MKSEAELMEWLEDAATDTEYGMCVEVEILERLFTGKKLVDAGAVVLSVEDAIALQPMVESYWWQAPPIANETAAMHALREAIEQAGGKND